MSYAHLFWFYNFKPDISVSIENTKVDAYIKRLLLDGYSGAKELYYDSKISEILDADVYYINLLNKKTLINYINKNCNLNVHPHTLNLEIILMDGRKHIFIESPKIFKKDLVKHCLQTQLYYNFRNHYLQNNNCRTPAEFASKFYDPIAEELVDFLSKTS